MNQLDLFGDERIARKGEIKLPAQLGPVARCRSCGAAIHWIKTEAGATMPISAATIRDGHALSHFVDCPDSRDWRKKA